MNARYFEEILGVPLLSHAEERALAERWRDFSDHAARNVLVQAHLRLVPPIARSYYRSGGSFSDLIAEGNLGLLRASAKYEPERGNRFSTYATYWIRALVSKCASRNSGALMKQPRALRGVRLEYTRATNLVGDGLEARRMVAERLQLGATVVDDMIDLLTHRRISLSPQSSEGRGPDGALCANEPSPEQEMLDRSERQLLEVAVRAAVATLSAREQRIVDGRLMVDADAALTLLELGREFGVSRERVRQVEANLKLKLRAHLRALAHASNVAA